jgi:cardiolipin synthase
MTQLSSKDKAKSMNELWQIVGELGLELHPDRIAAIAAKIESLRSSDQFEMARPSFGPNIDKSIVQRLETAWRDSKEVRPGEVASALRGASATAELLEQRGSIELVWTGPLSGIVPVRHTEQVLCEVIESARNRLFIVSFVAYEVPLILKALKDAVGRQVQIDVLLESSTTHGGKVTVDSVGLMKESIPSANIYIWNAGREKATCHPIGSVHAKCAVSDGKIAFITSANISHAAMERNMELGVLVKGGHLPDELHRHLEALVKTEIVERG